jgi:hypothetical protein
MMLAESSDYLPLDDLVKIVAVVIGIAVVAPVAAAVAIFGLERRSRGHGCVSADVGIAGGVLVLLAPVAVGLFALMNA